MGRRRDVDDVGIPLEFDEEEEARTDAECLEAMERDHERDLAGLNEPREVPSSHEDWCRYEENNS